MHLTSELYWGREYLLKIEDFLLCLHTGSKEVNYIQCFHYCMTSFRHILFDKVRYQLWDVRVVSSIHTEFPY